MPRSRSLLTALSLVLWTLIPARRASSLEDLALHQILDRAEQSESMFNQRLHDYVCRITTTIEEPQKDGTAKILRTEEKTLYRKLPDKRLEQFQAVTKDGRLLSPEELADYAKKKHRSIAGTGRTFFSGRRRAQYTYELMTADTIMGLPAYVIRLRPTVERMNLIDGKIWLHGESFDPLRLDFLPAKNPKYVKKLHLTIDFSEIAPDIWLPAEIEGRGRAGFLFFHKDFVLHERWNDFHINVGLSDSIFTEER